MIDEDELDAIIEMCTVLKHAVLRNGYWWDVLIACENERCFPVTGWGKRLLPTDVGLWSDWDCRFGAETPDELAVALSGGEARGERVAPWRVLNDASVPTDAEGWTYSRLIPGALVATRHVTCWGEPFAGACVRRRRWRCVWRTPTAAAAELDVDAPATDAAGRGLPTAVAPPPPAAPPPDPLVEELVAMGFGRALAAAALERAGRDRARRQAGPQRSGISVCRHGRGSDRVGCVYTPGSVLSFSSTHSLFESQKVSKSTF